MHYVCAGHESTQWAGIDAWGPPVKAERIQRHQQTSSKMWSQMRPPLSKQRSETYSMLYLQKVLQQQCLALKTWRGTLLLQKQCFCLAAQIPDCTCTGDCECLGCDVLGAAVQGGGRVGRAGQAGGTR